MANTQDIRATESYAYTRTVTHFGKTTEQLVASIRSQKDVDDLRYDFGLAQELVASSPESVSSRMTTFLEVARPVVDAFTHGTEKFEWWPTIMLSEKLAHDTKWLPTMQAVLKDAYETPGSPSSREWLARGLDQGCKEDIAAYQSHIAAITPILRARGIAL